MYAHAHTQKTSMGLGPASPLSHFDTNANCLSKLSQTRSFLTINWHSIEKWCTENFFFCFFTGQPIFSLERERKDYTAPRFPCLLSGTVAKLISPCVWRRCSARIPSSCIPPYRSPYRIRSFVQAPPPRRLPTHLP